MRLPKNDGRRKWRAKSSVKSLIAGLSPRLPGVMAYGESAAQAQVRAAIIALRAMVIREDGAEAACGPTMAPAVRLGQRAIWRAAGVDRCVAIRAAAWLSAAWLITAAGCALS